MISTPLMIDGKLVRRYIFFRYSHLMQRNIPVEVHAFNKDHAVTRLEENYPGTAGTWEFVQELENPAHTLGRMGDILVLQPLGFRRDWCPLCMEPREQCVCVKHGSH